MEAGLSAVYTSISYNHCEPLMKTRLLLLLLILYTAPAFAISKQQAMNIAQQNHPGRVLAVKQSGTAYRVKILNANGEVRIILVDAKSGKVLN